MLADTPYGGGIVLFNGTNSDSRAQAIYKDWLKRHEGTDRITGSKTADTRAALVEHFKERGTVMIATEAPRGLSVRNVLPATVIRLADRPDGTVLIDLACAGQRLLANALVKLLAAAPQLPDEQAARAAIAVGRLHRRTVGGRKGPC
jgi:hypothetical protein